jgi:cobalt-zinc-cadmium efflux system outer membrane protein
VGAAGARVRAAAGTAEGELRQLHLRYVAARQALDALAPTAALVKQANDLAARGYELGEGDLASVLLVRREAVAAEAALIEAELALASAKIELLLAAGRMPR